MGIRRYILAGGIVCTCGIALIASALFFVPAGAIIDKMGTKWMVAIAMAFLGGGFLLLLFGGTSLGLTYGIAAIFAGTRKVKETEKSGG